MTKAQGMRFVAVVCDTWDDFVTRNANWGFVFNVKVGTAVREGTPRLCLVYINSRDEVFTREKSQGMVYDGYRVFSRRANEDVVKSVVERTRSGFMPRQRMFASDRGELVKVV